MVHLKTSVILLAGGSGTRMQADIPKQFLLLGDKTIALHSFDLFLSLPEIDEIVVVCHPDYREMFSKKTLKKPIFFAFPGKRRQDSVYNGLLETSSSNDLICIHDAARPFVDRNLMLKVLNAASEEGAATLGMPVKFTVKEANDKNFVHTTPDRSKIWEIQTPQIIKRELLIEGFRYVHDNQFTVTDDVSLVELLGKQVKLIEGSHTNIKITVPIDMLIAKQLLSSLES